MEILSAAWQNSPWDHEIIELQAQSVSYQFRDHESAHSILLEITTYDVPKDKDEPSA